MRVWSLGQEDPMEKQMATHSSILAWRIPWTEEPGRQQSIESQRVRHDWSDSAHMHMPQFYQGGHNDALVTGINDYRTLCPTVFEMSGYFPLPRVKLPKQIAGGSVGKGLGDSLPYRLAVGLQDSSSQEPSFSFSQCSLGLKPRLDEETGQTFYWDAFGLLIIYPWSLLLASVEQYSCQLIYPALQTCFITHLRGSQHVMSPRHPFNSVTHKEHWAT